MKRPVRFCTAGLSGLAVIALASPPAWANKTVHGAASASPSGLTTQVSQSGQPGGAPTSSATTTGGGGGGPACSYSASSPTGGGTTAYDETCGNCGYAILNAPPNVATSRTSLVGTVMSKYPNTGYTAGTNGYFVAGPCVNGGVTFNPVGAGPAAGAAPAPIQVAATAVAHAPWPKVVIDQGPQSPASVVVNIPEWTWLSSGWSVVHATAAIDGVAETITATPTQARFSTQYTDSANYPSLSLAPASFTCNNPGSPYVVPPPADTPEQIVARVPPCGYTWHWSSELPAGHAFPLTAQVCYSVTYSGASAGSLGTHCGPSTTVFESVEQVVPELDPPPSA